LDENDAFIVLNEGISKAKSVVPIFKLENAPHLNVLGLRQPITRLPLGQSTRVKSTAWLASCH
jgi:hypothetical protein